MFKLFIGLIVLLQLFKLSLGHLCLFDPPQREPNFAVPIQSGDNACYRVAGNCGNITAGAPIYSYNAGDSIFVSFQQNYNHWYKPNPGYLEISISYDGDYGPFQSLSGKIDDFNAWDMVTQTNYSVPIVIPTKTCKNCVLQVTYISNNKGEPYENFYQCSDIAIQ